MQLNNGDFFSWTNDQSKFESRKHLETYLQGLDFNKKKLKKPQLPRAQCPFSSLVSNTTIRHTGRVGVGKAKRYKSMGNLITSLMHTWYDRHLQRETSSSRVVLCTFCGPLSSVASTSSTETGLQQSGWDGPA
jgi:hypothetical protein